jgi:sensor histidine kinase YesM
MSFSHTIPTGAITSIQGSSFIDDKFWMHTPKGTFVFDEKNKSKKNAEALFNTYLERYFEDKNISCVIKDRQNNYWFSTTNQGVFLVSNLQNTIYPFEGFLPNKIVAITPNKFIIGTKKGELIACNGTFDKKTVVKEKTDHSEIYYLKYDTISNDLFYTAKHFIHLPNLNYADSRIYTLALKDITHIDANYYAFTASGYCGLVAFDSKKIAQNSVWDSFYFKGKMPDKNTAPIIQDVRGKSVAYHKPNKTIYLATNIGLYLQTPKEIKELKMENKPFYAAKVVIYEDNIFTLNTKGNLYAILNERDFISLNNVFEIKEFDILNMKQFGKYLFLFTRQWLYVLDMHKNAQKLQKINININPYEINDFLIQDNFVFLLTDNGIIKTALNNTSHQNNKIIFQINEFLINDKKQRFHSRKRLKYYENDLKIHFSVLDFGSSYQNKIFYRINQDNWKIIDNETRTLTFAQLAVGHYEIEFKVNDELSDIKIIVDIIAPFWKTNWFFALCFLLLTALLTTTGILYYRFQLGKIKAKNVLLQEKNTLLKEKIDLENNLNKSILTSIKAQMNPHFFFNALNTIQAYIFTNDKAKANSYLAKFSKLTRIILEQSEKETISLNEEIQGLTLYLDLEKMRFENVFEYKITFSEQFDSPKISKEIIEIPPMIIQPYVENAIKHGLLHQENNRKLEVFFDIEQNEKTENSEENDTESYLKVIIDDNGIGRKRSLELNKIKNEKYQSFSTKANQKRLEILNNKNNKKIAVQIIDKINNNNVATGTQVIIIIPIKI